jgi:uncharacterized protein (DUF427 family)/class 3 adenylate cyclase
MNKGLLNMGRSERVINMAPGFSVHPDYQVSIKPSGKRIRAMFNGQVIADSSNVLVLNETRHAPTYYFPKSNIDMSALIPSEHHTHCPFKGNASYWSIQVESEFAENVVWAYEQPYKDAQQIEGHVSFYWDKMEAWYEDDVQVFAQSNAPKDAKANPLVEWMLSEAWEATTSRELTHRFVSRLNECGMNVMQITVVIQTLHPLLAAIAYRWKNTENEVTKFEASHDTLDSAAFQDSPLQPIFEGAGGVRRRIDDASAVEFPILADLRAEGATDYAAMPMRFSDGQVNAITIATDEDGGFTTENLGHIHEVLPILSRLYEVHAKERSAATLMRTFMGKHTGERVLNGQIKRGDGEDLHAVIWFSDLRNSTPLAESMSRAEFLIYLNQFFDGMAGSVADNGGEILRFIGDAVLAIFPIEKNQNNEHEVGAEITQACKRAVNAAKAAMAAISEINLKQLSEGKPEINFGIGMHIGDLTYGNIGIPERLEFTVIGSAVNEAARIEATTKDLGIPVLISDTFATAYTGDLKSVGKHRLRGVENERHLFTVPD